jgi:hypothetical protein
MHEARVGGYLEGPAGDRSCQVACAHELVQRDLQHIQGVRTRGKDQVCCLQRRTIVSVEFQTHALSLQSIFRK